MKILPLVQEAIVNAETAIRSNYPTIKIGEDSFLFSEIASRSKQRFDLLLSSTTNAKLYTIIRNALPPPVSITNLEDLDLEMDLSIVYSKPGANHQGWHADGNHLVGASDAELPYAICIFIPLIDLNVTVGYTQFWLGSHKYKNLQGFGKFSEISNSTCDIGRTTKKGNGILYDYRLLHREQEQEQPPYYRPVLQLLCRRKFYKEKNNYGTKSIYDTDNDNDMQNK
ncbi:hypothetical protein FRACYDRAFT_193614 [Fragilariopsis cylindrus CCMP1102]|uniref:Phytanoyl-CoA dioxygenase n=1 Tax=Fragilariopsis cylindrus CCMP1102 TaxID=635003 RepID=A0A1E7EWR9_9STRA|nr:hypothetical protein FRACYDRAFT_193614 [Fragilariopsis cylindrus CCMP1102]|eukprot:OEU10480.1 hypothetical protein FRACYDRAFT_193614 [Fragilariopsis cylindrus CCMP1102]